MSLAVVALVGLCLGFGSTTGHAQGAAEITGTISDSTGAVVPHASVTLTNEATGVSRTTLTNGEGLYEFTGLDVGKYDLKAQMTGFSNYQKSGIVVDVAAVLREDVALQTGAQEQTVTVEANALQVQSESNEVSTLVTGQQILQLATNGRNVYDIAGLGTGVSSATGTAFNGVTGQGSSANYSFNGMRPGHNVWMINGGEVYDRGSGGKLDVLPAPDMLDEFQVLSSNYTPDYGIGSGGTILMVLKQGTKAFHGAAWEFNRNDAFDAYPYFSKQTTPVTPKPELRLNIFGGTIGGPLFIPHVYNSSRTKTFFFWGEEWRRFISGSAPNFVNTIPGADFPTSANESGGFLPYTPIHGEANPIVPNTTDPAEVAKITAAGLTPGGKFQTNSAGQALIPVSLFDPNAVLFLGTGAIPAPNAPNNQFTASPKQPTYVREDVVRIDHNITDKLHLLGSWIHDQMSQTYYPPMWSSVSYVTVGNIFANPSWASVIKLTQTLSPTLLNETSFNVNGNTINITPQGIYAQPSGWSATSLFTGNNPLNRMPEVNFNNGPLNSDWSTTGWPWKNSFLDYQIRDDLSKLLGRHALKFGASYMRMDKNQQLNVETQGDYGFNGTQYSDNSYVNFLLGFASSYSQQQSEPVRHYNNNTYSFYANDDWHANRRLTLNLGFRYDALPQVYEKNNQVSNFNPAHYNPVNAQSPDPSTGDLNPNGPGVQVINGAPFYLNGIDIAGQNGVPRALVNNDYYTIQPRIGFAYDLSGNGKTALRGGMGIFYERVQGNDIYNIAPNVPFSYAANVSNVYFSNPSVNNQTGAAAAVPFPVAGLTVKDAYYPNPGTMQYSLGLQHELAPGIVATLQTVDTNGWNQDLEHEINDLTFSSPLAEREAVAVGSLTVPCDSTVPAADCLGGFVAPSANLYRTYQGYGNIVQYSNKTNFSYYSLQAQIRVQQRHGVSAQFAYTWSHEIDIKSDDLQSDLSNPYDINYDRGSGSFDRRHIFNANVIYDLPWYTHSGNAFQRTALGGWQFSDTTVAETGVPLTVTYNAGDTIGLGGNTTNRPDVTGPISTPKTQHEWFNTSAFTKPVAPWLSGGTTTGFGNAGKDMVRGPGLLNFNMMVSKNFFLTSHEGPRFQLRAECFNVFNHTEFNGVDTGLGDGNFGQVTSTISYSERTFQFSGKFNF